MQELCVNETFMVSGGGMYTAGEGFMPLVNFDILPIGAAFVMTVGIIGAGIAYYYSHKQKANYW